eukprot:5090064-Ditylum_brightwellii.AAC.2
MKCKVVLNNPWTPQLLRESDMFIMDVVLNNLSSLDGKYLTEFMYDEEAPTSLWYTSSFDWPQQGRPNK